MFTAFHFHKDARPVDHHEASVDQRIVAPPRSHGDSQG